MAPAAWQLPLELPTDAPFRVDLNERCWVEHRRGWLNGTGTEPDPFAFLRSTLTWLSGRRNMYGRVVAIPRLMNWQRLGDPEVPELLRVWGHRIDREFGTTMTSAGLNLYRDGSDSVSWHGDLVGAGRDDCTVAVVSLGAGRPMLVRPTTGGQSQKWMLDDGDLFVMGGRSQQEFQHSIPKVARCGERISVVFRETSVEAEPEYGLPPALDPT